MSLHKALIRSCTIDSDNFIAVYVAESILIPCEGLVKKRAETLSGVVQTTESQVLYFDILGLWRHQRLRKPSLKGQRIC